MKTQIQIQIETLLATLSQKSKSDAQGVTIDEIQGLLNLLTTKAYLVAKGVTVTVEMSHQNKNNAVLNIQFNRPVELEIALSIVNYAMIKIQADAKVHIDYADDSKTIVRCIGFTSTVKDVMFFLEKDVDDESNSMLMCYINTVLAESRNENNHVKLTYAIWADELLTILERLTLDADDDIDAELETRNHTPLTPISPVNVKPSPILSPITIDESSILPQAIHLLKFPKPKKKVDFHADLESSTPRSSYSPITTPVDSPISDQRGGTPVNTGPQRANMSSSSSSSSSSYSTNKI